MYALARSYVNPIVAALHGALINPFVKLVLFEFHQAPNLDVTQFAC
jgi:hypothetical protein